MEGQASLFGKGENTSLNNAVSAMSLHSAVSVCVE